jgi:hypothetical protein
MLRITIDLFSGRPDPTWIVTDDKITRKILSAVADERTLAGKPDSGFDGLGFRGVKVDVLTDDDDLPKSAPRQFVLAGSAGAGLKRSGQLAADLIKGMTKWAKIELPEHSLTPINAKIQKYALQALQDTLRNPPKSARAVQARAARRKTIGDNRCDRCNYEISLFNPGFWNNDSGVRRSNNCYNYARNWRTNTFAQPGRASGHPASAMSCAAVSAAARSDGLVDRCRCLPQSEYPRRLMALVIAPGYDYHWYRHQIGDFWGHKPGQTAARNTDNSGVLVANPETCDRGPYTNFCGYFYAGKSVRIA